MRYCVRFYQGFAREVESGRLLDLDPGGERSVELIAGARREQVTL